MEMAAESVEFGSDGSYVTVGSAGGLAEFRSTSAPYFVTQLFPTGAPVTALALDKRDKYVITGSADGSVIIWQPMLDNLRSKSGRELMDIACSRLWTNLGQDKWKQYFATEPYRKTCPALN
jgi:WD40 repeat protein